MEADERYREVFIAPLLASASYLPKMGTGRKAEVDLDGFTAIYGSDPFYHWVGLDSPLMYAAHKAAGGMTSIYRQLGIGSERLFRTILRDELGLTDEQVVWSYQLPPDPDDAGGRPRILALDGRIEPANISSPEAAERVSGWIDDQARELGISIPLNGAVFEIRQGYKSKDSKRQNADLYNATQALGHGFLPVLGVMSAQINNEIVTRYRLGNWVVLRGTLRGDSHSSTFLFLKEVVGYDIVEFFERNTTYFRTCVESVLQQLLEAR